jgi:hypothetical protein
VQFRPALRYAAYPANGASLILIAITSILFCAGWWARVFGIPLMAIMLTWFLKFGLVIVEHIAWQVEGKPVLSVEMLNPVEQKKSFVLLIVTGVFAFMVFAARVRLGKAAAAVVALIAVALMPAAVAVQTGHDCARKGLDVREWVKVIRWLKFDYVRVLAGIVIVWLLGAILLLGPTRETLPLPVLVAILMFAWLSVLALLGGAILDRRLADPDDSPLERREQEVSPEEIERRREHQLDSIYGEWRSGAQKNAWQTLMRTVTQSESPIDELRWLHERTATWQEPRLSARIAQELVPHLLASSRYGEAIAVTRQRLETDEAYRPVTADETLRLVRVARDGGDRPTARALLRDFQRFFPADPLQPVADDLARELER